MMTKIAVRCIRRYWRKLRFFIRYICACEKVDIPSESARQYLLEIAPPPESTALTHNKIGPEEYDLTIIVPAYNAEKWIEECLNSILDQKTKYSYLVKVVNDGSKDHTPELIEKYRANPHIQIIHQENRGYSGARNAALKELRSAYVMFVDSDDYLLPGAIELLMDKAKHENADIVEGNGFRFNEKGRMDSVRPSEKKGIMGVPWMKVFRSTMFESIEFPEKYLYEDTIICSLIAPMSQKTVLLSDEVYAYRIHGGSITWKRTAELNRTHSYWIMELMHEHMGQLSLPVDYEQYCLTMKHIVFTYRRTILLPEEIKKNVFAATCGFIENTYPQYTTVKDRYTILAQALVSRNYGKYKACCEADLWWNEG